MATAAIEGERLDLKAWQATLFPTGFSSVRPILVGAYRQHVDLMQLVQAALAH